MKRVLVLLAACSDVPMHARNRELLPSGNAPEPTIVLGTLECHEPGADAPHIADVIQKMNLRVRPTHPPPAAAACDLPDFLAGDAGMQWHSKRAPGDVLAAMHDAGAKSAVVSFARTDTRCKRGSDCLYVATMVFDDAGNALWRGQKLVLDGDDPLVIFDGLPVRNPSK
jgi:hypothetical protein